MRRIAVLVGIFTVLLSSVAWAGKPAPGAKIAIGKGVHTLQLTTNADGTIKNIESGSIPIRPADVESVLLSSQYKGYKQNSVATVPFSGNITTFANMANNDGGQYMLKMKNGKFYRIKTEEFSVSTFEPIFYRFTDEWMEYGERVESSMKIGFLNNQFSINVNFGCDIPVGIIGLTVATNLTHAQFVTTGGETYSAPITKDANGNYNFRIEGIPATTNEYGQITAPGMLYVVDNGISYAMRLYGADEEVGFIWYSESETRGAWINPENGSSVTLTYYPSF